MISLITPNRRQHHDVNGRMRVEPEQVLEQHRVAPSFGSKMPMPRQRSMAINNSDTASTGVASTMIKLVA